MAQLNKNHLAYVLELDNISKEFPGVKALDNVTIKLKPGEVLAICGENGAGKSTLINCISGVYRPDQGDIKVDGVTVNMKHPQVAFSHGISVVHQERHLIPTFDIAENISLDNICGKRVGLVNKKVMVNVATDLLLRVKLDLKPTGSIDKLSSGQKQMLEIARALSMNSHILLLDEPTASISINEVDTLLETIRELRAQGVAIIYVSHKLEEILAIADRVVVIRDGKSVGGAIPIADLDRERLIEMMVGSREIKLQFASQDRSKEPVVIEVEQGSSKGNPHACSFKLHKGEILGWYGLVGAGRTELAKEVIGVDPIINGELKVHGKPVKIASYKEAVKRYRMYYVSENRKEEGLFCLHRITTNISIVILEKIKNRLRLNSHRKENLLTEEVKQALDIKTSSIQNIINSLSGGNQQKVCFGKCLMVQPEIIFIDEPTVGIDVKTKAEIHKMIYRFAQEGKAIVLITSDLAELIQLADRIQVFRGGLIVGELENTKRYEEMSSLVLAAALKEEIVNGVVEK